MRMAARCFITVQRRSSAPSTQPAANSTASSVTPSADHSSYPQIPRTRLYYKAKVGCLPARFWCDNISVLDRTVEDLGQSKTAQSDSGASSIPAKVSLIYCFFLEDFDVQEARKKAAESRLLLRKFPTPRLKIGRASW